MSSQRPGVETRPAVKERTQLAPRWRVIIHNDDVTPMDFVVAVLLGVFGLERIRATRVMLEAHTSGVAHVATFALEEAEARVDKAHGMARVKRYPLTFTYEPDA